MLARVWRGPATRPSFRRGIGIQLRGEAMIMSEEIRTQAPTAMTEGGVGQADIDNEALREQVEAALDTIRPAIAMDGGNVELLDIEEGVVTLRMMGACGGCPMSTMTLKRGIEERLKAMVPGIERVDSI
jgi:Fe-S cluster biogenesis protein NfuA